MSSDELPDDASSDAIRDCRNDMDDYVGQLCVCGQHEDPPLPHASEVIG